MNAFGHNIINNMKQISLEEKVNNTLKWLANKIACIQVYHWDEEYKKESLNDAWQKSSRTV